MVHQPAQADKLFIVAQPVLATDTPDKRSRLNWQAPGALGHLCICKALG